MNFFSQLSQAAPLPATIITPGPVGAESHVHIIGANGPTGSTGPSAPQFDNDSDDLPEIPFTFEQEQNLLLKMNNQQSATIEELQKRIQQLEKELLEKPFPPVCYIKCSHCLELEKDAKN